MFCEDIYIKLKMIQGPNKGTKWNLNKLKGSEVEVNFIYKQEIV